MLNLNNAQIILMVVAVWYVSGATTTDMVLRRSTSIYTPVPILSGGSNNYYPDCYHHLYKSIGW